MSCVTVSPAPRPGDAERSGRRGGEAEKEAQAREQYWLFVAQVEQRLSDVFTAEAQLRYMMGLAVADGRQIRPADEPTAAAWVDALVETLSGGRVQLPQNAIVAAPRALADRREL